MFSANKFDSFKQSLASAGKNSQTKLTDNKALQGSQTTFNNMNFNNEQFNHLGTSNKNDIINLNGYNINSAIVSPKNSDANSKKIFNSGVPNLNKNSNTNPIETMVNYNFGEQRNNNNTPTNNNNETNNRGTIRSALKFDYGMKISSEKVA